MKPPYASALVACSAKKNPYATTARSLYRGSLFMLSMRHAMHKAERVLIMSAKYGLLRPEDQVRHYDAYLPELSAAERAALLARIRAQADLVTSSGRLLSYLPAAYWELLAEALPELEGKTDRPYKGIRLLTLCARLAGEIKAEG